MQNDGLPYLLALHSVDGLGPIRLKKVLSYFKDPRSAWFAPVSEFLELGIPQSVVEALKEKRKNLDPNKYFEEITSAGIKVLTIYDQLYPVSLKEIYDPPLILFYKGEIKSVDNRAIGVVGSRKITGYGKLVTEQLTAGLVENKFTIVSGLARGVDTVAHVQSIKSNGRTIAVLGGGLKVIFPPENTPLAQKIWNEGFGAVISEFAPDYPHLAGNFPARNRIIAGLSKAVLVTEAAQDSGSMITAKLALEYGREVFTVPGPITSALSLGPAKLIKEGARIVTNHQDILEELGLDNLQSANVNTDSLNNLNELEKIIIDCLNNENKHIDEISRELKLASNIISSTLLKLEILGVIRNLGGGIYSKTF